VQPHYTYKAGGERWGEAVVLQVGGYPIDRKPATDRLQDGRGQKRQVQLNSNFTFSFAVEELASGVVTRRT